MSVIFPTEKEIVDAQTSIEISRVYLEREFSKIEEVMHLQSRVIRYLQDGGFRKIIDKNPFQDESPYRYNLIKNLTKNLQIDIDNVFLMKRGEYEEPLSELYENLNKAKKIFRRYTKLRSAETLLWSLKVRKKLEKEAEVKRLSSGLKNIIPLVPAVVGIGAAAYLCPLGVCVALAADALTGFDGLRTLSFMDYGRVAKINKVFKALIQLDLTNKKRFPSTFS